VSCRRHAFEAKRCRHALASPSAATTEAMNALHIANRVGSATLSERRNAQFDYSERS
jgi:hypothetical protein